MTMIFDSLELLWRVQKCIIKSWINGSFVATINRCPRCNYVLNPKESPCPHCGQPIDWKSSSE